MITPCRHLPPLLAVLSLALGALGCDDDACEEPDVRGAGAAGDPCVTVQDCAAGLACLGTNYEEEATCAPVAELPGNADPGCLTHPDEWVGHRAHGVQPPGTDDDGCERLTFVSACNCVDTAADGDCLPLEPIYRLETWRRCAGCCWRLVSLWDDDSVCPEEY
jgi:hypothetical protein